MAEPPTILAFDTSGPWIAAALMAGDVHLCHGEEMPKGQAEHLMSVLEDLLGQANMSWADLDAIGVGTGPGNFTGIRIAISAARGLAMGLNIPAYGIDAFAQRARLFPNAPAVVPAPRGHVYLGPADAPRLLPQADAPEAQNPTSAELAGAIAGEARALWPSVTVPPRALYARPADAAPPRDAPPRILDDA